MDKQVPEQDQEPKQQTLDVLTGAVEEVEEDKTFLGRILKFLRVNFFAGLVVLAPLVITLWLFKGLVIMVDNTLLGLVPQNYHLNNLLFNYFGILLPFDLHGLGVLAGISLLVVTGLLVRNIFGKTLLHWGERMLGTIPGVSSVYNAIKQITETVTSANSKSFRKVVMVEYPRKGIWAVGFVSGVTQGQAQKEVKEKLINVFLPTTPNPTSGFLLFFPEKDLIELDMTVDQGLRMIISAGIVTPTKQEGLKALKQQAQKPAAPAEE